MSLGGGIIIIVCHIVGCYRPRTRVDSFLTSIKNKMKSVKYFPNTNLFT